MRLLLFFLVFLSTGLLAGPVTAASPGCVASPLPRLDAPAFDAALMQAFGDPVIPEVLKRQPRGDVIDALYGRYDPRILFCILGDDATREEADAIQALETYGGEKIILAPDRFSFFARPTGQFETKGTFNAIFLEIVNYIHNTTYDPDGECSEGCQQRHAKRVAELKVHMANVLPIKPEAVTVFQYTQGGAVHPEAVLEFLHYAQMVEALFGKAATREFDFPLGGVGAKMHIDHYTVVPGREPLFIRSSLEPLINEWVRIATAREDQLHRRIADWLEVPPKVVRVEAKTLEPKVYEVQANSAFPFEEANWSALCMLGESLAFDGMSGLAQPEKLNLIAAITARYCTTYGADRLYDLTDQVDTSDSFDPALTYLSSADATLQLKDDLQSLQKLNLIQINLLIDIDKFIGTEFFERKISETEARISELKTADKFGIVGAVTEVAAGIGGLGQVSDAIKGTIEVIDILSELSVEDGGWNSSQWALGLLGMRDELSPLYKTGAEGAAKVDKAISYIKHLDPATNPNTEQANDLNAQLQLLRRELELFNTSVRANRDTASEEWTRLIIKIEEKKAYEAGIRAAARNASINPVIKELVATHLSQASADSARECLVSLRQLSGRVPTAFATIVDACRKHSAVIERLRACLQTVRPDGRASVAMMGDEFGVIVNNKRYAAKCFGPDVLLVDAPVVMQ
jgi:hypothetical protein